MLFTLALYVRLDDPTVCPVFYWLYKMTTPRTLNQSIAATLDFLATILVPTNKRADLA
jgi:hypothetical protein